MKTLADSPFLARKTVHLEQICFEPVLNSLNRIIVKEISLRSTNQKDDALCALFSKPKHNRLISSFDNHRDSGRKNILKINFLWR